jgi:phospholipid transport system substrate-binding protein
MRRPRPELVRVTGLAVAALVLASGPSSAGAAITPAEVQAREFVQQTIDTVMGVLHNKSLTLDQKKDQVESIAYDRFDFPLIARLVLAQNWRRLTQKQQEEFVAAFKSYLSATYRNTLDNFRDEKISVDATQLEPRGDVTVMTVVHGSTGDTHVNYRMRKTDDGWRGIDVIIEGVSLVQNFRAQAQDIMSREGADALIARLRDRRIQLDTGVKKSS